ncbi:hypothetical protein, variant 1 [Aphanomyces invadans]|uniref:Uncharacterized protein n=1 Tax=Aphanomyces invadans TaxID=157072 RepID=A0A024U1L5_9STRA|nr:hypothetical protein, variant 1 [Aphanomyces invadans]ETW00110.1 hypothetical protein, variant 1 [Aphanomyces invadans]|eukprot:XP_008871135.1 hypothetical protein, variant 1 [Aphanomyces invadans]
MTPQGLLRMTALLVAALCAHAKTILHISDVHLNITLESIEYGHDTSPRLFASALAYAKGVLQDPDLLLYTGDAVAHVKHNESILAKSVETGFNMVQDSFHLKNVTAILGNADCLHDYEFYITDTEETNPTIGMVDAPWKQALSPSHFKEFDTRGYLWYTIEPKLVLISLNTVPYSIKHSPNTKHLNDPFGQFAWLRATLHEVEANGSYAYIAGHIPPIIDSYGGESQWELKYLLSYKAIVRDFPSIIKAQLFGHVHSVEFRVPVETVVGGSPVGVPLFASGAISPMFGNNPSFTIWEYNEDTFDIEDFSVYATNLTTSDATALAWKKVFSAKAAYNLTTLSSSALHQLTHRMKADDNLLNEYYRHSKADSQHLPVCVTTSCLDRVLCTQIWFDTEDQFLQCVDTRAAERAGIPSWLHPFPHSSWVWSFVLWATVIAVAGGSAAFFVLRAHRRSKYQTIHGATAFEP